jgi:hypothetical protein
VRVDVVGDPEPALAVEQTRAAPRRERLERGRQQLRRGGLKVAGDPLQAGEPPLAPPALVATVRGAVAMRDEPAGGKLAGARQLGRARLGRAPKRPQVVVEVGS